MIKGVQQLVVSTENHSKYDYFLAYTILKPIVNARPLLLFTIKRGIVNIPKRFIDAITDVKYYFLFDPEIPMILRNILYFLDDVFENCFERFSTDVQLV